MEPRIEHSVFSPVPNVLVRLVALLVAACNCLVVPPEAGAGEFRIIGYLPEYRVEHVTAEQLAPLTDLIAFSIELRADGTLDERRWTAAHWQRLNGLRREGLRVQMSVGGWDRSAGFGPVVSSRVARERCTRELVELCRRHKLSGVDLDWEHPSTAAEQANFTRWLRELRLAFDAAHLEFSLAVAPSQKLPGAAWTLPDRVIVMAYDDEGQHSTAEQARRHVTTLTQAGLDIKQAVLGVPFYGRHRERREEALTYAEIVQRFDPTAGQDEAGGYSFNGPDTIRAKTRWARDAGMSGISIWEIGQDAAGEQSLLRVVQQAASAVKE